MSADAPKPKQVNLILAWGKLPVETEGRYKVVSITNSVEFHPGQWVDKDTIAKVNERPNWQITSAEDDTWKQVLGFALQHVAIPTVAL